LHLSVSSRESNTSARPRSHRSAPSLRSMRSVPPSVHSAQSSSLASSTLASSGSSFGSASNLSLESSLALPLHHPPASARGNAHISRHKMVLDPVSGLPIAAGLTPVVVTSPSQPQRLSEGVKAKLRARTSRSNLAASGTATGGVNAPLSPPPNIPLPPVPSQSKSKSAPTKMARVEVHIPTSEHIAGAVTTVDDVRSILMPTPTLPLTKSGIERSRKPSPLKSTSSLPSSSISDDTSDSSSNLDTNPDEPSPPSSYPADVVSRAPPFVPSVVSLSRTNSSKSESSISGDSPPTHAIRVPKSPSRWSSSSLSSVNSELKSLHHEEIPAFAIGQMHRRSMMRAMALDVGGDKAEVEAEGELDAEETPVPSPVTPKFLYTEPLVIMKTRKEDKGKGRNARMRCGTPIGGWLGSLSASTPAPATRSVFVAGPPRSASLGSKASFDMKEHVDVERWGGDTEERDQEGEGETESSCCSGSYWSAKSWLDPQEAKD
jgi:hypothetical protein